MPPLVGHMGGYSITVRFIKKNSSLKSNPFAYDLSSALIIWLTWLINNIYHCMATDVICDNVCLTTSGCSMMK